MTKASGFLLIDKPAGCSSFDVIRQLRRITGIKKIGHTGTLDPLATGLLICALGANTRLCKYLEAEDKTYSATVRLGIQTDTGDAEGEIVRESEVIPEQFDEDLLRTQVEQLEELLPPQHSALKVRGLPAYAYARRGEEVELAPRPARISEFQILSYSPPNLNYVCQVSKGTYIRSLSEFIASCLGTVGHTINLRREAIGTVEVGEACQLEDLNPDNFQSAFYSARKLFSGFEFLNLQTADAATLKKGQSIENEGADTRRILLLDDNDIIQGVARREAGILFPVINIV